MIGPSASWRFWPQFRGTRERGAGSQRSPDRLSVVAPHRRYLDLANGKALPREAGKGPWQCGHVTRFAWRKLNCNKWLVRQESLAKGGRVGNVTPRFWQCYSESKRTQ